GIVVDGETAFVSYLEPFNQADSELPVAERLHRESVVAMDVRTGRRLWRFTQDSEYREDQETFGGRMRAPQSTPLLFSDPGGETTLVTVSFDGKMHALNTTTGNRIWSIDLVKRFSAVPVQFGFSSSPIEVDGQIVLLAGGERGGLVALDPQDGKLLWSQPCGEASYATPVVAEFAGTKQIVFVTRNRVVSVDTNGKLLWEKNIATPGLTNVPTPLVLSDGLVLSGQGFGGTVRWSVDLKNDSWAIEERWASDEQFFYCNWGLAKDHLIGCTTRLLVAIDLETGETVSKVRGYAEANVAFAADQILVTHGKDELSCLTLVDGEFQKTSGWSVGRGRCWTPPTWTGDICLMRTADTVFSIDLLSDATNKRFAKTQKSNLTKGSIPAAVARMDEVAKIVAAFQRSGAQAALAVYQEQRKSGKLDIGKRLRLAEMAVEIDESDLAKQIVGDALEDANSDIEREQIKQWLVRTARVVKSNEKASSTGKNGLSYLKIGLLNLGATRHAEVRGPEKHPFGYGLPLRRGQVRLETWPVGTRLTDAKSGKILLEVKSEDAGKVLIIE
ncbi:MAG: PQQ-binding-like beta-propeller repeat protein, partial [Planctomycetota bacterium]